jgi:hypothetical protein
VEIATLNATTDLVSARSGCGQSAIRAGTDEQ